MAEAGAGGEQYRKLSRVPSMAFDRLRSFNLSRFAAPAPEPAVAGAVDLGYEKPPAPAVEKEEPVVQRRHAARCRDAPRGSSSQARFELPEARRIDPRPAARICEDVAGPWRSQRPTSFPSPARAAASSPSSLSPFMAAGSVRRTGVRAPAPPPHRPAPLPYSTAPPLVPGCWVAWDPCHGGGVAEAAARSTRRRSSPALSLRLECL